MRAALFSTSEELDVLLKREDIADYELIALTPAADYAASKQMIRYSTIEEICNFENLFNCCANNFGTIEKLIECLRLISSPRASEIVDSGYLFLHFKIFYDKYFIYSEIFEVLLKKYEEIIYFFEKKKDSLLNLDNLNILSIIADSYGKNVVTKKKFICLDFAICTYSDSTNISKLKIIINNSLSYIKHKIKYVFSFLKGINKQMIMLDPSLDYALLGYVKREFSFFLYPHKIIKKRSGDFNIEYNNLARLCENYAIKKYLKSHFVDQVYIALQVIHSEYVPYVNYWIDRFSKNSPRIILSLLPTTREKLGITIAAKKLKIAQIIPQHGGNVGYNDCKIWNYLEKKHADVIPVYGKGCVKTFYPFSISLVGSFACYEIYKKRKTSHKCKHARKKILFISDNLQSSILYCSNHVKPGIETARMQRKVIDVVQKYGDIFLKLYPWERQINPVYEWLEDKKNDRIVNLNPKKLEDVLLESNFDLIVTDAPATTLLYAVSTNVPIIAFYDKRYYRFIDESKELLKKRVMLFETYNEFMSGLEGYLKQFNAVSSRFNDEFLFTYGLASKNESPQRKWHNFLKEQLNNGEMQQ